MRIAEFTAYHVRIRLRKTIRHASFVRRENDTLIVRCRLDDGTEGWGEGLPRPYVTGETIASAWELLQSDDIAAGWQEPLTRLSDAVALCRDFAMPPPPSGQRDCFGNTVRCAFELSVLDAVCQVTGQPLSAVTACVPETEPIRQSAERVQYSTALTATGWLGELLRSAAYRLYGFHQMKVKVGVAGQNDAATLRRVRRVAGRTMDLRIDANEAWMCESLEQKLEPLLPFGITAVEQPVPHADVDGLAAVRSRLAVPIMLDESLCSIGDAERAIDRGSCDLFNIRLSKCGGFVNSLLLAAMADDAGLGYQLGCQVGETGILSAAGRHFATSVAGIRYLEGSFDRHLVKEPLTRENLTFGRGGYAPALDGPGLGITMDEQALRRVTVAEHHIPVSVPVVKHGKSDWCPS